MFKRFYARLDVIYQDDEMDTIDLTEDWNELKE